MQLPGDIRRRHHNGKGLLPFPFSTAGIRVEILVVQPFPVQFLLDLGWVVVFLQFFHNVCLTSWVFCLVLRQPVKQNRKQKRPLFGQLPDKGRNKIPRYHLSYAVSASLLSSCKKNPASQDSPPAAGRAVRSNGISPSILNADKTGDLTPWASCPGLHKAYPAHSALFRLPAPRLPSNGFPQTAFQPVSGSL